MKKYFVWVLLLYAGFSLPAQTVSGITVFVLPVTGTGSSPYDNELFDREIYLEVILQQYAVAETENEADYILRGTLTPTIEEDLAPAVSNQQGAFILTDMDFGDEWDFLKMWEYEPDPLDADNNGSSFLSYLFRLELLNNITGDSLGQQALIYQSPDDLSELIQTIVSMLLYEIQPPDNPFAKAKSGESGDWRNKWLYFTANALWVPRFYYNTQLEANIVNFGFALAVEGHVFDFLSLEFGAELTGDWIATYETGSDHYRDMILQIPIAVKYVLKPLGNYTVQPYTGIHINVSLFNTTKPPIVSWMLGFQYCIKAGPGAITIDPRFALDAGLSSLEGRPANDQLQYQRTVLHIGIGYKYGILSK